MRLLTEEIRRRLPGLYETDGEDDPIVQVKFFATWCSWTWYATEFDGDNTFFGLVYGHVAELGYFSLSELQAGEGKLHQVERDFHFMPSRLSEVRRIHRARVA